MVEKKSNPATAFVVVEVICLITFVLGILVLLSPLWISGGVLGFLDGYDRRTSVIFEGLLTVIGNTIIGLIAVVLSATIGLSIAVAGGIGSFVRSKQSRTAASAKADNSSDRGSVSDG